MTRLGEKSRKSNNELGGVSMMSQKEESTALVSPQKNKKRVPEWFYSGASCCYVSLAATLWWLNLFGAVVHFVLAIVTAVTATSNGTGMDTPRLTLYLTNLTWVANSTDPLLPSNVPIDGISLAWLTMCFFLLSALAHLIIVVGNWRQAFALHTPDWRMVTDWTGWYYVWIHECRQPLRWLEYSFSASIMIITISAASGIAHVYMIVAIFSLMWCTMVFGYFTEELSRPKGVGREKAPEEWATRSRWQRLTPHLLGWVPYLTVWFILLHSFIYNVSQREGGPPFVVYLIVAVQAGIFTIFGLVQFVNQFTQNGPSWYYRGECIYLILSLTAKAFLGGTLIGYVFMYETFDEAFAQ